MTIERPAKLFEAGSYPDKGITITEEDLDALAASFTEAPVRVEHSESPFDGAIGALKRIWRAGRELFGTIAFTPEAWALIDSANARKLSVGIKRDKSALTEVSLVKHPYIAGAQVFGGQMALPGLDDVTVFYGELEPPVVSGHPCPETETDGGQLAFTEMIAELQRQNATLKAELASDRVDSRIAEFKRRGKVVRATEDAARAILLGAGDAVVEFNQRQVSLGELFEQFLEAMPPVVLFGETCRADTPSSFTPEQREVFRKLGIDESKAAAMVK
jgi:phage I-like protein